MNELLSLIVAVKILSEDLHYRSKGTAFYALHILADKVKEGLDGTMDELRESYYMGDRMQEPPCTCEIYSDAIARVNSVRNNILCDGIDMNKCLVLRLKDAVHTLFCYIETLKSSNVENMTSGTIAILDNLSASMTVKHGLLDRTGLAV